MEMTDTAVKRRGGFHYAYLIIASCIAVTFVPCALVLSCAGIFFTPVAEYFGVPRAEFTLYFTMLNLAQMVSLPIAGKLMEKFDLRIVFSACVALIGVGFVGMSQIGAVWQSYIFGILLGLGNGPLIYLMVPTLVNAWCKKRVGFFVGLCMAFTGIGGVLFNPVGTMLIGMGAEGWRTAYLVFAVLALVCALPFTALVVRNSPVEKGLAPYGVSDAQPADVASEAPANPVALDGVPASRAFKSAAFIAVVLFMGLITLNLNVYSFLPSYMSDMSATIPELAAYTGIIASVAMAGQAIGKVALGVANDKSVRVGLFFGIVLGIVGVLLMMFFPGLPVVLLIGAFLFGFVYACGTVEAPLLVRGVFGSMDYAAIYSKVSMAGPLCAAIAAVFWGFIIDLPNGFTLMFVISLALMVTCLALGLFSLGQREKLMAQPE